MLHWDVRAAPWFDYRGHPQRNSAAAGVKTGDEGPKQASIANWRLLDSKRENYGGSKGQNCRPLGFSRVGAFFFRRFSAFLGHLFEFFGGSLVNTLAGDALA